MSEWKGVRWRMDQTLSGSTTGVTMATCTVHLQKYNTKHNCCLRCRKRNDGVTITATHQLLLFCPAGIKHVKLDWIEVRTETFDKTGRGVNNKLPSDGMISVHLQDGRTSVIYQCQDHAGKTTKVYVKRTAYTSTTFKLQLCHRLLPVQVNEEAEEVISQLNHALLHVGLELTPVMNLGGIKHTHVSHRNLYAPEGRARNFLNTQQNLVCDGSLLSYNGRTVITWNVTLSRS